MSPVKTRNMIQFINLAPSDTGTSAELKRQARSHAARTAHAKTRKLRVLEYQAVKASQIFEGPWFGNQSAGACTGTEPGPSTCRAQALVVDPGTISHADDVVCNTPSPVDHLTSYRRDPFPSFAYQFQPMEHFLFHHYISQVIPYLNTACGTLQEPTKFLSGMTKDWIGLALNDVSFLHSVFLCACRHMIKVAQQQQFLDLATHYKIWAIREVNRDIATGHTAITEATVAKTIVLAWDEMSSGNFGVATKHMEGAVRIVGVKGGPRSLGLEAFLQNILRGFYRRLGTPPPSDSFLREDEHELVS